MSETKETDPRIKDKGFEPEKGSYKKSADSVGELYPVIKDEFGIIDGFHRKEDKPDWHEKELHSRNLKEHYKKMLHANFQRRIVPEEQMKEWINGIAKELLEEGKEPPLGQEIEKELGGVVAYRTIMRYLDEEYKRKYSAILPRGKNVTLEAKKEAEIVVGRKLETAEDFKAGGKALLKMAEEKQHPRKHVEEKKRAKRSMKEIRTKRFIAKEEAKKELLNKLLNKPTMEIKKAILEKSTPEELEKMAKEKRIRRRQRQIQIPRGTEYRQGEKKGRYIYESGVEWCDYGINIYYGCGHDCKYCYGYQL